MNNIRILVLSHMYPRVDDPISGNFIHYNACSIRSKGFDVTVLTPLPYVPIFLSKSEKYSRYMKTPFESYISGIHVFYPRYLRFPGAGFHPFSCYTMYYGVQGIIKKLIHDFKPHILHAHTATPDGYVGLLLRRKFRIPLVVSLRGSDVNVYPYRNRLTFFLTSKVIAEANKVTAVSGALKSAAERIARPQNGIEVIYTGCDLERFSFNEADRVTLREKLGIPSESPVLIFVGHILKTKGVFELLKAFLIARQMHGDLHLIVVGDGEDFFALKQKAEAAQLSKWIHFLGARSHDEIPGWLSVADILVLPSWNEGLPNVVVEAMACKRPVIATRVGGIPEAVDDGKSGILIEKGDVEALANAISLLVSEPAKRVTMGLAGRQIVEQKFTWEKNAESTIAVYEEVLRNASR